MTIRKMEEQSFKAAMECLEVLDPYNVIEIRDHLRPKIQTFELTVLNDAFTCEYPPGFFKDPGLIFDLERVAPYLTEREIDFDRVSESELRTSFANFWDSSNFDRMFSLELDSIAIYRVFYTQFQDIQIHRRFIGGRYSEIVSLPPGMLSRPIKDTLDVIRRLFDHVDVVGAETFCIMFRYSSENMAVATRFEFPSPVQVQITFFNRRLETIGDGQCDIPDREAALEIVKTSLFLQIFG